LIMFQEPRKLTFAEFQIFARHLGRIKLSNLEIEYKAYEGFLRFIKPEHRKEFYEFGYITIGKWRLWPDLEISPAKTKLKTIREILPCTDGNNYDLPYFDQIYQKYTYLANTPEKLIDISNREDEESRSRVIKRRNPRRALPRLGKSRRKRKDPVVIRYKDIFKGHQIQTGIDQSLHITNVPEHSYLIMKIIFPKKSYRFRKLKSGNISINRIYRTISQDRIRNHNNYQNKRIKFGSFFKLENNAVFKHSILQAIIDFSFTYNQNLTEEHLLLFEELLDLVKNDHKMSKRFQRFGDRVRRGHFIKRDERLLKFLQLPIITYIFIDQPEHQLMSSVEIMKYYDDHPEHLTDFMGG